METRREGTDRCESQSALRILNQQADHRIDFQSVALQHIISHYIIRSWEIFEYVQALYALKNPAFLTIPPQCIAQRKIEELFTARKKKKKLTNLLIYFMPSTITYPLKISIVSIISSNVVQNLDIAQTTTYRNQDLNNRIFPCCFTDRWSLARIAQKGHNSPKKETKKNPRQLGHHRVGVTVILVFIFIYMRSLAWWPRQEHFKAAKRKSILQLATVQEIKSKRQPRLYHGFKVTKRRAAPSSLTF